MKNIVYVMDQEVIRDLEYTYYCQDDTLIKKVCNEYKIGKNNLTILCTCREKICDKNEEGLIKLGNRYDLEKNNISLDPFDLKMIEKDNFGYDVNFMIEGVFKVNDIDKVIIDKDLSKFKDEILELSEKYHKQVITI